MTVNPLNIGDTVRIVHPDFNGSFGTIMEPILSRYFTLYKVQLHKSPPISIATAHLILRDPTYEFFNECDLEPISDLELLIMKVDTNEI